MEDSKEERSSNRIGQMDHAMASCDFSYLQFSSLSGKADKKPEEKSL